MFKIYDFEVICDVGVVVFIRDVVWYDKEVDVFCVRVVIG